MRWQRPSLALAVLSLFSLLVTTGVASAQSGSAIAAEQSCLNAAKQNNNSVAVSACTQALSLVPDNATMALILCYAYFGVGDHNATITSCTRAIALDTEAQKAYLDRCYAYLGLADLANAASDCTQAIKLDPNDEAPHVFLGLVYLTQQNYVAALAEYNRAILLKPNSDSAFAGRGVTNLSLGNKATALADFQKALTIDPTNSTALKGMAQLGQTIPEKTIPEAKATTTTAPAASGNEISICNQFSVGIHAVLAYESEGHFIAAGWWNVDPNQCQAANFTFQGAKLYYAADSDSYRNGSDTMIEHWGDGTGLYVSDKKFNFDDAEQNRSGTRVEKFDVLELLPAPHGSQVTLTFGNHGTDTEVIVKQQ
jgi:tetratricopeptide (TPR) repeat protein